MQSSEKQNTLIVWLLWQFYDMPKFLIGVWKNYILFALNYFSLPILLKSLLAPWRRYRWNYPRGFHVVEFLTTLISNVYSRFMGALVRVVLIIAGIIFQIFVIFAGLFVILLWILVPFIIILGFLFIFFNVI
ncbi:MAG: hypothetical protein NTY04_02465 [Candidatus Staskawiczbacteria bacterium]|nr:hypothetical protein [Candidatus Staskawiczbacteria bacterium]